MAWRHSSKKKEDKVTEFKIVEHISLYVNNFDDDSRKRTVLALTSDL